MGQIVSGNIDLYNRPKVKNPNGGTSTVYSASFNIDGKEVLLPLSDEGRILSESEAVDKYRRTGQHLGIFATPDAATAYAKQLHDDYESGKYDAPMTQNSNEQGDEVVIRDEAGAEHVFPAGFDPKRAASIVREQSAPKAAAPQSLAKRVASLTGDRSVDPDNPRPTLGEVGRNLPGALGEAALGEIGGAVVGKGLRLVGRGLYRAAALPLLQTAGKYGDMIGKGLEEAVPVTKAGATKAANLKMAAQATKRAAVSAADGTAGFRTQGIVDDALSRVQGNADELRRAGLGDPTKAYQARTGRIVSENGPGIKPSELESIKGTIDDTLGPAYKKLRMREALTPNESMSMALSHAAGDAQSTVIPNYKALNKEVMDSEGLRRMIVRRLQGNQGLENALTMAAGPAAIPARIAMLPGVASTAGIAAHHSAPALSQATRAALLALMGSQNEPEQ